MDFKKIALMSVLICVFSSVNTFASRKPRYGMAGCGLGSVIFGANGPHVFAATTNGTSETQGFGITSGTSNCKPTNAELAEIQQEDYFLTHLVVLSKEMAQGDGQVLEGLASLMGCQTEALEQFKEFTKNHYTEIFSEPGAIAALHYLKSELRRDSSLSQSCLLVAAEQS